MTTLSPSSSSALALLPGRSQFLPLCRRFHAGPRDYIACDDCLRRVAGFLAREIAHASPGGELQVALDRPTEAWQAELGEEYCTLDRARVLRFFVVKTIIETTSGLPGFNLNATESRELETTLADFDLAPLDAVIAPNYVRIQVPIATYPSRLHRCGQITHRCGRWLASAALWSLLIPLGGIYAAIVLGAVVLNIWDGAFAPEVAHD